MVDVGHASVVALSQRLALEYAGALAAGVVAQTVLKAWRRLSGIREGDVPGELLEQVVRRDLTDRLAQGG